MVQYLPKLLTECVNWDSWPQNQVLLKTDMHGECGNVDLYRISPLRHQQLVTTLTFILMTVPDYACTRQFALKNHLVNFVHVAALGFTSLSYRNIAHCQQRLLVKHLWVDHPLELQAPSACFRFLASSIISNISL